MSEYSSVYAMLRVGRKFCQVAQKKKDGFLSQGAAEKAIEIILERYPDNDPMEAYHCKDEYGRKGCRLWHTATELPSASASEENPIAA